MRRVTISDASRRSADRAARRRGARRRHARTAPRRSAPRGVRPQLGRVGVAPPSIARRVRDDRAAAAHGDLLAERDEALHRRARCAERVVADQRRDAGRASVSTIGSRAASPRVRPMPPGAPSSTPDDEVDPLVGGRLSSAPSGANRCDAFVSAPLGGRGRRCEPATTYAPRRRRARAGAEQFARQLALGIRREPREHGVARVLSDARRRAHRAAQHVERAADHAPFGEQRRRGCVLPRRAAGGASAYRREVAGDLRK